MTYRFRRSCCCVLSPNFIVHEDKCVLICTLNWLDLFHHRFFFCFFNLPYKDCCILLYTINWLANCCMPPKPPPPPQNECYFNTKNLKRKVWEIFLFWIWLTHSPLVIDFFKSCFFFFLSSRPFWNQNRPIDITGAPRHNSGPKHAEFSPNIQQAKGSRNWNITKNER